MTKEQRFEVLRLVTQCMSRIMVVETDGCLVLLWNDMVHSVRRVVKCHQDHVRPRTGSSGQSTSSDDSEDVLLKVPTSTPAVSQKDSSNPDTANPDTDSEPPEPQITLPSSSTKPSGLLWPFLTGLLDIDIVSNYLR